MRKQSINIWQTRAEAAERGCAALRAQLAALEQQDYPQHYAQQARLAGEYLSEMHTLRKKLMEIRDQRDTLQVQLTALAAENLDLKHPGTYLPSKRLTPATDAIKRHWMAEGVDEFGKYHNFSEPLFIQKEAVKFAARLRQAEEKGNE